MNMSLTKPDLQSTNEQYIDNGYCVVETPALSHEIVASFDELPRDCHSMSRLRKIRLSQYFGYFEDGEWIFGLLPKRRYIQSPEYIKLKEAGGVLRYRDQLTIDPSPLMSCIMQELPVDAGDIFHLNVNQIRVIANEEYRGVTVPEGPHRDGHEFSVIAVAARENVVGGETQIIDPNTGNVVFRHELKENEAIIIDDERYVHYATNIEPEDGSTGYRDIWVIEINKWENRAYGPAHEKRARGMELC